MRTGKSAMDVRTQRSQAFSIPRREVPFTAIVVAKPRSTAKSAKPRAMSALEPSVASPCPHTDRRKR